MGSGRQMYQLEVQGGTLSVSSGADMEVLAEDSNELRLRADGGLPVVLRFEISGTELLVGLGERFGQLEQTGRRWEAAITDLLHGHPEDTYCYVPFLLSSAGYGVLLETSARALWDLKATDPRAWSVSVAASPFQLRVFRGQPKAIIAAATKVIGRPPLAPPWAYGVWKTTLSGTEAILSEARAIMQADIPVTACWTYDYYDEATNTGCGLSGSYPSGSYPNLSNLSNRLHDLGYRVLGYVQPAVFVGSQPFDEASREGYLVRRANGEPNLFPYNNPKLRPDIPWFSEPGAAYIDMTNPAARSWFQNMLQGALDMGFDGWMQDMGEHLGDRAQLADGSLGAAARNRYAELYHQAAHEVWSHRKDVTVFARSGALGSIAKVNAMWPGDQHADWTSDRGLPSVIPAGPSIGLAGVTAWGPDIGGLIDGRDGGAGVRDEELWIRWCQYGALTPIMRDHLGFKYAGGAIDMWSGDRTVAIFRTYARLHLALFPYLWRLAREASDSGIPILRALLIEYPDHPEAWSINDQYLLGADLLVAPVTIKGAVSRRVWFPPGVWISWWDDTRWEGTGWREVPAPLEQIPLFRREGGRVELSENPDRTLGM